MVAKNFITKMRKLTLDAQVILINLINNGYSLFGESLNADKLNVICQMFTLGKANRLHPIRLDLTKKDYKAKLTPNEPNAPSKSELSLSIIDSQF